MSVQRIASRYAKSLFDLANERGKLERVLEDVESFHAVSKNRDFELLLKSPVVKSDKKEKIFDQLFSGKYDEITMAFLQILLRKGREAHLAEIAKSFIEQYRDFKEISTVKLTTAAPLSEESVKAIHDKLAASKATSKHLEIVTEVDPSLLGGFVVEFQDKLYDASISHKLEKLKKGFQDNHFVSKIIA